MRRGGVSAAVTGAALLWAARAGAHEVGLSRGEYVVRGASAKVQVLFARRELIGLVAGLDADHDGALTAAEVTAARGAIEGALVGRIEVRGDGAPCPGTLEGAELTEQDGIDVRAVYRCARRPQQLTVKLGFLDDVPFGHRHLARATAGAVSVDRVLSQRSPSLSLDLPPDTTPPPVESGPPVSPLRRGVLRVLGRPEAPAFLLALLVTCATRRAAVLAAAAFAVAAAAGLALGARGLFLPSPRVLGAAVALSLVYAGLDAAASPDEDARWRLALPFGVVHGLGWAAAREIAGGGAGDLAPFAPFAAGALLALAATSAALVLATRWTVGALGRPPSSAPLVRRIIGVAVALAGAIGLFTGRA